MQQAMERIKRDLIPTWQSGIIYWPILDFITFRYLPVRLQVCLMGTFVDFSVCPTEKIGILLTLWVTNVRIPSCIYTIPKI